MNLETMTVKELLDLFREYTRRENKPYSLLCLYDDGSGRIMKFSDLGWSKLQSAMYDYPESSSFNPWELISVLAGE